MNLFNKSKKSEGKELYDNFDYLVTQIKEEWLCSKEGKKKVLISKNHVDEFNKDIIKMHDMLTLMLGNSNISFQEYMALVKQNCIVIRIAKKLVAGMKSSKKSDLFEVLLDKEEYKFFIECYPEYR